MNILMIYPKYPDATFWNANISQRLLENQKALLPPLGLLTIASYFPPEFEIRLIVRNVREETEDDWQWADAVLLSLMAVQKADYLRCLSEARRFKKPVAIGGPYTHAFSEEIVAEGDWICFGEAESIMPEFISDLREGRRGKQYQGGNKTNMESVPVPRYDLLENIQDYGTMAVQFSRGCPFLCEFCDIIEIYGRVPRTKSPAQVIREFDLIKALGYRGNVFLVDDNFIGNKKRATAMLRELAVWNRNQKGAYHLITEASLNLADEDELLQAMSDANMVMVFIGIETPDPVLLKTTKKTQNIPGDQLEKLNKIRNYGIHITAGFILGFDGEKSGIFEVQRDFIQRSGIGVAMLGLLTAIPHTGLSRRLKSEGRLLEKIVPLEQTVDGINFIPKGELTKRDYLENYSKLVDEIYQPENFFGRILPALLRLKKPPIPGKLDWGVVFKDINSFIHHVYYFGIKEKDSRRYYWKAFFTLLFKNPRALLPFGIDCFFFYHLKRHARTIRDNLSRYLTDPLPDDVLDQKISNQAQAVGF